MGEHVKSGEAEGNALERLIFRLRGRRAMLDGDLARLYGVSTGRFNEAFKRNRRRFPEDFAFQVSAQELENLRSQIAISSLHPPESPGTEYFFCIVKALQKKTRTRLRVAVQSS